MIIRTNDDDDDVDDDDDDELDPHFQMNLPYIIYLVPHLLRSWTRSSRTFEITAQMRATQYILLRCLPFIYCLIHYGGFISRYLELSSNSLQIYNVTMDDAGFYKCRAVNIVAEKFSKAAELTVNTGETMNHLSRSLMLTIHTYALRRTYAHLRSYVHACALM